MVTHILHLGRKSEVAKLYLLESRNIDSDSIVRQSAQIDQKCELQLTGNRWFT